MRVCTRKSDGRIIEAQSGSAGGLAALRANAQAAGIDADVVEMPDAEFATLLATQMAADRALIVRPPTVADLTALLTAKGVLTDLEISTQVSTRVAGEVSAGVVSGVRVVP